jgi:type II secretory pathway pseudopilin PulG
VFTIAIAGGVALLIVLVTRGSFEQLLRLPIQSIWLVVLALVIQITLAIVDIPSDRYDDLGIALVMVSYGLLLAFCFVNLRVSMMWLVALGIGLNAVVIGLNQGMPTRDREVTRSGRTVEEPIERTVKHRPESDDDLLGFLGDKIVVPEPVDEVVSIGDLVIGLGVIAVFYAGSRVRRPDAKRPSRRAERTAAIRQRLQAAATREQTAPTTPPPPPTPAAVVSEPTPSEDAPSDDTKTDDTKTDDTKTDDTKTDDTKTDDTRTDDDAPAVELDQVLARMASDEGGGDPPPDTDDDEPHQS